MTAAASATPPPSFRERFVGVLVRPRETFRHLAESADRDAWYGPAYLLIIGYSLYFLAIGVGMARLMSAMAAPGNATSPTPPGMADWMTFLMSASQLYTALWQVPLYVAISWAVRTGIFYGLGVLLHGDRPAWGRVVAMIGWAWVPIFFQYVLLGVLMLAFPPVMDFFLPIPEQGKPIDVMSLQNSKWQGQVLFQASPFILWNLYLCTVGVANVFRLPTWKASVVVLVPALAQILFNIGAYFLSTWMAGMFLQPGAGPVVPNGPGGG